MFNVMYSLFVEEMPNGKQNRALYRTEERTITSDQLPSFFARFDWAAFSRATRFLDSERYWVRFASENGLPVGLGQAVPAVRSAAGR